MVVAPELMISSLVTTEEANGASKLLSEETTSITEICLASGFNNFSHFNKAFKNFVGKSPSAYRNEVKKMIN